jgi:RNA polymerase sigma factor (TIGR02999 family)
MTEAGVTNAATAEELMPLVYDELRRLARGYMSRETPGHTLQPTALVHEAYLRLVDTSQVSWQGRTHFFAVGARVMRRLLIDHARGRGRQKRGGDWHRVTFSGALPHMAEKELDLNQVLGLNDALERLTELDERQATVVELRFFGGLTVPEVAHVLGVSQRTIEGDWTHARAWLKRELDRSADT